MMRKKQGRCERERRLQNDRREKMGRMFLYGTLCGVDDGCCSHIFSRNPSEQRSLAGGDRKTRRRDLVL